jgi:hypothetical protein
MKIIATICVLGLLLSGVVSTKTPAAPSATNCWEAMEGYQNAMEWYDACILFSDHDCESSLQKVRKWEDLVYNLCGILVM